jgi:5-methylthioadenosine/S-adenosylhomocysteine deaminase
MPALIRFLRATALTALLSLAALGAEPADWIVTARYVLPMDGSRKAIERGAVAIRGHRILAVGSRVSIEKRYTPERRLDRPGAILIPGLVNAHTHVPMSLFRGIADDLRLQDWLEKFIFPAEAKNVSRDFVTWGARLACLEMILSGTTTFADMYYFEDAIAAVAKAAGMRAVLGETIIGFPVADAKTPADSLKLTEAFLQRFKNDPLITAAPAPHALYTNSEETIRAARALANKYGAPMIIHLSETKRENDDMRAKYGASPTQVLERWGAFDGRTLAAHGVWLDDADLEILKRRGAGLAHCPSSNMKLASGIAAVTKWLRLDLAAGLGTDGPAGSNNDFWMFEEMDLAAKLQKVATGDPQALSAWEALEMATIRGARALGLEKQTGSLEPGKLADLITVRITAPHAVPLYDPASQLVYALKGSDVQDSMVNGRLLMRDRAPLTLNRALVLSKAREYARKVRASLSVK